MGEPQMNDQVNESVGSGPQWIGWTLVSFILFTPFIVIKLMDGKTKQAKHNTYIHGIKLIDMIMKLLVVLAGLVGTLAIAALLAFGIVMLMIIVDDKLN